MNAIDWSLLNPKRTIGRIKRDMIDARVMHDWDRLRELREELESFEAETTAKARS